MVIFSPEQFPPQDEEHESCAFSPVANERQRQCDAIFREIKIAEGRIFICLAYGACTKEIFDEHFSDLPDTLTEAQKKHLAGSLCSFLALPDSVREVFKASPSEIDRFIGYVFSGKKLPEELQIKLEAQLGALDRVRELYDRSLAQSVLLPDLKEERSPFAKARQLHRQWIAETAALLTSAEWFSPALQSSQHEMKSPFQEAVRNVNDYGRAASMHLLNCTKALAGRSDQEPGTSMHLTGGGMQAFHLAMHTIGKLLRDEQCERPVLVQEGIYWEVNFQFQTLLETGVLCTVPHSKVSTIQSLQEYELARQILQEAPGLVVCAPVCNSLSMQTLDIGELFEILSSDDFKERWKTDNGQQPLCILIDNTVLGEAAPWKRFNMRSLPSNIVVCSIESLLKLRQDGFDHAPAGSITWYTSKPKAAYTSKLTESYRFLLSYAPVPDTVNKLLLAPTREYSVLRSHAINENTALLAASLAESMTQHGGVLSLKAAPIAPFFFISVAEGLGDTRQHRAGVFDRQLSPGGGFDEKVLDYFMFRVLELAKHEYGIPLMEGTSFGFDNTRLSLMPSARTPCRIRISPGTEEKQVIKEIGAIFARVLQEMHEMFMSSGEDKNPFES